MESKRLLKISWICITLFLGIIIYFNIHPIPTLIKPGLTITIKNSDGGFFNTTNSVKNLEDAENNFYVKFNIKKVDYVSKSDFNIYDNNGKQVPIIDFSSTFAEYSSNDIQIWFKGKANTKYRLVYMGEPIGNGLVPFPNLEIREIEATEIAGLEKFRNGVDWGYGVDPMAFVRWGYDKKKRIIYAIDEFFGVGIKNRELAAFIISKNYDELVIATGASSTSPKDIKNLDAEGVYHLKTFNEGLEVKKEMMKKSTAMGMQTFDQALYELYERGDISFQDAIKNADSAHDLRLDIQLRSRRAQNAGPDLELI